MTQEELKDKIITNALDASPLVLKYKDNTFICKQYAEAIAVSKNLQLLQIESLSDLSTDTNMFDEAAVYLYYMVIPECNIPLDILSEHKDLIIMCQKVPSQYISGQDYIEIAPLVPWQIEEFLKVRLPGLNELAIRWLCNVTKYNIYRLDNECKKIEQFPKEKQQYIFDLINADNGYLDLNNISIFDLTNAVMKKDKNTVGKVLSNLTFVDVEPVGLITIFRNQLRKVIDVKLNPYATAENTGIPSKQFAAIKYSLTPVFTKNQLINMYEFITSLDYRLKNGDLQFNKDAKINSYNFIDYIITRLMYLGQLQGNIL